MEFVDIGKVCGTHGISGEIKIRFFYDISNLFDIYPYVLLKNISTVYSFRLENYFIHKNTFVFKLEGLNNINYSIKYRNFLVILPISLKEYIHELNQKDDLNKYVGIKVYDECSLYVGEISEYYNFNGNIVFNIVSENKSFLVNYNSEHIVNKNISQNKIVVLRSGLVEHNI
jgi:16S rRNA processing protein RimM